jgi:putative FmdB family regulatory protein
MPLYEYKCKDCGNEYEELVSVNEKETPPCPSCKSVNSEKKVSLIGSTGAASCGNSGFT